MTVEEHMELWREKEPWIYSRLVFNRYTYALIMMGIMCSVGVGLFLFPFTTNMVAVFVGYFLAQFIFQMGHLTTHALYIEAEEEAWEPGVMVAYLHHYQRPRAIYRYWLIHRLNFLLQTRGSLVAYGAAWAIPFLLFGKSILLLYAWFLFWFSMVEPAHEWYHVPGRERRNHFSVPMFYWLSALSASGIMDEEHHLKHHAHSRKEDVTKFSDMYFPFSDGAFDVLWRLALRAKERGLFKENPIRKSIYASGIILVPSVFSLGSYLFLLGGGV